jgi:hypothetical protein
MKNLFYMGGPLFMSCLTILLIVMVIWIVYHFVAFYMVKKVDNEKTLRYLAYGKSIGLFSLVFGILGNLIGLYMAFSAIEQAGDIAPVLVYGGLKVSIITTLYGIFIYLLSLLLWFITSIIVEKKQAQ